MLRLGDTTELRRCEALWRASMPAELVTDLWEFRECFDRHFRRPRRFVFVQDDGAVVGLLPLAWIREIGAYGYFPGETWQGRTWIEGNRIVARDREVLRLLLAAVPAGADLRYLLPTALPIAPEARTGLSSSVAVPGAGRSVAAPAAPFDVDEVGYLFSPPRYGFDLERWFGHFSFKNAKRLRRAVAEVEAAGIEYRFDDRDDVGRLIAMNRARFGRQSYFDDRRFRAAFEDVTAWLAGRNWLRITTVLIAGVTAAIDVGAIYRRTYTLLAGATHADYPGVAKVINLHHLRTACAERFDQVDFLCGDFAWKPLFHLEPRPLYRLAGRSARSRNDHESRQRPVA